jgi:hypothetical protein
VKPKEKKITKKVIARRILYRFKILFLERIFFLFLFVYFREAIIFLFHNNYDLKYKIHTYYIEENFIAKEKSNFYYTFGVSAKYESTQNN